MKVKVLLLGAGMLAATVAFAQDTTSGTASGSQDQTTQSTTRSTTSQNNVIRGCLSGSSGNYTVTDQNGMQYEVNGDDNTLQASVGREVEIRLTQHESTDTSNQGSSTTKTTNSVQASQVTALSNKCHVVASPNNAPPNNNSNPSTTPQASLRQAPQLMAMLQQQEATKPETGAQQQNQMTPPVTSQTPATPNSPTNSQVGSNPASSGMSGSDAQAAPQANPSTNPQTNDATGVSTPSTANPSAMPSSPTSAPQANADDPNKPLYERQATDVPWAQHTGGSTGTSTPQH